MSPQDLDRLAVEGGRFTLLGQKFELSAPTDTQRRKITHLDSGTAVCTLQRYSGCVAITAIHEERRTGVEVGYVPASVPLDTVTEYAAIQSLRYHRVRMLKGSAARRIWDPRTKAVWLPWPITLTPEVAAQTAPNLMSMLFGGQQL